MTDLMPPAEALASIPALYATEATPAADKTVHAHYFIGACDWWLAELDPATGLAFGYADLGDPASAEWGYFNLTEMAEVRVRHPLGFEVQIERDEHFTPCRFADL